MKQKWGQDMLTYYRVKVIENNRRILEVYHIHQRTQNMYIMIVNVFCILFNLRI